MTTRSEIVSIFLMGWEEFAHELRVKQKLDAASATEWLITNSMKIGGFSRKRLINALKSQGFDLDNIKATLYD